MVDFTSFLEANQSSALVTNSTGQILEMNKSAEALLGCRVEMAEGENIINFLPVLKSYFGQLGESARLETYIENYILPSNERIRISILPNRLKFGNQNYIWFILKKLNKQKKDSKSTEDKEFYKKILKQSRDVILLLDSRNRVSYVSPSSFQLMGYNPHEIIESEEFRNFIYSEDRKQFDQIWKESLKKRERFMMNRFRFNHKDGTPMWMEVYVKREYDERGRLIESIANLRNITDRIDHQLELEKIRERYQLAVEAGHNGIWDYSFKEKRLYVDKSLKSLLGYGPEYNVDERFFWNQLVAPEDSKSLREALSSHIREGKSYFEETFQMTHRRRVLLWVLGRGKIFYEGNKPTRIICSVTDITDKIKSNEKLRNALINFKAIFDAFPDLFIRLNRLGDFLEVMAGESADHSAINIKSFEGSNMKDALPPPAYIKVYECLQRSFESHKVELCEYDLKEKGEINNYEARIIAITDNEAIGIVRNITEAVRTNMELLHAKKTAEEALNAKDEFLSMMSHEIRTPLNVVIGMTYLMLQQNPTPAQLKLINTLKFSSDNLLRLINDLLDFSKIKAGKLVFEHIDFNLKEFIWNIFESYKLQLDSSRVELLLNIDETVPTYVNGDYSRLTQILNNLLSNAQKFTDNGQISIAIKQIGSKGDYINIQFEIRDTGIGIPSEKISAIFEPFQQGETHISTRYGGTGLGLTIVKQLIELLGGKIKVSSEKGKGSKFTVVMPFKTVDEDTIAIRDENLDTFAKEIQNIRILYAEDVSSNQFLMKGYADLWKFELDIASNGEEAVKLFVDNNYDVVLLDLQMPVMDGFQAAERIREIESLNNKPTPILAVTGDISEKTILSISESGMNDYIIKPINPKIMIEKIQELLHKEQSFKSPAGTIVSEYGYDNKEPINFADVDYLYGEVPNQYTKLVELLLKEFSVYKKNMLKALKEEDYDEFRQIRHSMRSNIRLLQMNKMEKLVDKIRNEYVNNSLPPGGGFYVEKIAAGFDELLQKLEEKLRTLTN
jgi:PAS domain S-box-containing protein